MTQVLCPQCGRHVDKDAKRCPHCGKKKQPFPVRLAIVLGLLLVVLLVAGFSGTVARYTMPRDIHAGTARACVAEVMPTLLDEAMPGFDWSSVAGRCRPTWYKALRYGLPSITDDSLSEGEGR